MKGTTTKRGAPTLGGILGEYPPRDGYKQLEYQVDRHLIWVMCPSNEAESICVQAAEGMLGAAFDNIPSAIRLAEEASRTLFPEIWAVHDRSRIAEHRMDVWGIRLFPDSGAITYEINRNHDFDFGAVFFDPDDLLEEHPIELPELPEHFIGVDRSPTGALQVRPN